MLEFARSVAVFDRRTSVVEAHGFLANASKEVQHGSLRASAHLPLRPKQGRYRMSRLRMAFILFVACLALPSDLMSQTCLKDCGCDGLLSIGHRECGEGPEPDCHVGNCSEHDPAAHNCWSQTDTWMDFCGADMGWGCEDFGSHSCTYLCGM